MKNMPAATTSIRLDSDLGEEAVKVLRVKFRTEAVHVALREIVSSQAICKIDEEERGEALVRGSRQVNSKF